MGEGGGHMREGRYILIRRDGACFHAEKGIFGNVRNGRSVSVVLTILILLSDCFIVLECLVSFVAISLL